MISSHLTLTDYGLIAGFTVMVVGLILLVARSSYDSGYQEAIAQRDRNPHHPATAAVKTLEMMQYEHGGGIVWRPPLGEPPLWVQSNTCNLAPEGWLCSRTPGHTGPCAVYAVTERLRAHIRDGLWP